MWSTPVFIVMKSGITISDLQFGNPNASWRKAKTSVFLPNLTMNAHKLIMEASSKRKLTSQSKRHNYVKLIKLRNFFFFDLDASWIEFSENP